MALCALSAMPPSWPFGIAERKRGGRGPRYGASDIREEALVTPENHKAIARRFFEDVWNKQALEAIDDIFAASVADELSILQQLGQLSA